MGKGKRTQDAKKIHDKAVRMRKMTDEQLVHYVEDRVAKAEREGYNSAKREFGQIENNSDNNVVNNMVDSSVKEFLDGFKHVPGVGKITYKRLVEYAKENEYILEGQGNARE